MSSSPGSPARDDLAGRWIHDLHLDKRVNLPDGGDALLQRVVQVRLEGDGAGLGHAIADLDLAHVHAVDHLRASPVRGRASQP